jgi:hypothetical protein
MGGGRRMGPSGPPRVRGQRVCEREGEGFWKLSGIEHDFFEKRSPAPLWATTRPTPFASLPPRLSSRYIRLESRSSLASRFPKSRDEKKSSSSKISPGNPGNREMYLFLSDVLSPLSISTPIHNWDLDLPERDDSLQSFSRGCGSLNRPAISCRINQSIVTLGI